MLKILHISNDYFNTTLYENLHNNQKCIGIDSYFIVPVMKNTNNNSTDDTIFLLPTYKKWHRWFFFWKSKLIYRELVKLIDNKIPSIDLIHAHFLFSAGILAFTVKKNVKIPYIVAVRDTDLNFFIKRFCFLRPLAKKILRDASKIIFLSPGYREETAELIFSQKEQASIIQKSVIIPNGIDKFWFFNLANIKVKVDISNIHIITVGEVCKRKNQITVCKAIELLIQEGYNIYYTVIGKANDEKILSEILKYPFVHYFSHTSKEQLINYYRNSTIFVLPSLTETFGLVYGEALSQGLPIIYSIGQGFDGQFEEGVVGFHVEARNPIDIAEKIKKVLENYEQITSNCITSVENFRWESIAKKYSCIYQDCIKTITI